MPLRRRSGYWQAQLAKGARISQAWVGRLETGDENPTLASVTRGSPVSSISRWPDCWRSPPSGSP